MSCGGVVNHAGGVRLSYAGVVAPDSDVKPVGEPGPQFYFEVMMSVEKYLAEIKGRVERATPGPWKYFITNDYHGIEHRQKDIAHIDPCASFDIQSTKGIGEFIRCARTDIPKLVEMVEVARAALGKCSDGTCRKLYGEAAQPQQKLCLNCQALAELDRIGMKGTHHE